MFVWCFYVLFVLFYVFVFLCLFSVLLFVVSAFFCSFVQSYVFVRVRSFCSPHNVLNSDSRTGRQSESHRGPRHKTARGAAQARAPPLDYSGRQRQGTVCLSWGFLPGGECRTPGAARVAAPQDTPGPHPGARIYQKTMNKNNSYKKLNQ